MKFAQWIGSGDTKYGFVSIQPGRYRFSHWADNDWRFDELQPYGQNGKLNSRYCFMLTITF